MAVTYAFYAIGKSVLSKTRHAQWLANEILESGSHQMRSHMAP